MAGNVEEWVKDWYDKNYYETSPSANPIGPDSGESRVVRGGFWLSSGYYVRSAYRSRRDPKKSYFSVGFRCAMDAE